jgi:hypothetical protein
VLETVSNISFLSTILQLCSEIALSRKPFGIGHMYIYTFLLRMTDTESSQNIDLSSWDILYKSLRPHVMSLVSSWKPKSQSCWELWVQLCGRDGTDKGKSFALAWSLESSLTSQVRIDMYTPGTIPYPSDPESLQQLFTYTDTECLSLGLLTPWSIQFTIYLHIQHLALFLCCRIPSDQFEYNYNSQGSVLGGQNISKSQLSVPDPSRFIFKSLSSDAV